MSERAEAFRRKALQYERAASIATDPDACRAYLDLARQLRARAEQKGNSNFTPFWSGQAAPLGREMPARALTLRLVEEAIERFTQLNPK